MSNSIFFSPESIAVIGASEKPGVGKTIFTNIAKHFKGKIYPVTWKEVNMDEAPITWEKNGINGYAKLGDKGEVKLEGIPAADGKQAKLDNVKYWGAQKNTGFYLAYGTHFYKGFGHDYKIERMNGFFIHIESEGELEE